MSLLLAELCERLKDVDEITLMERLGITSEDLISHFMDEIEEQFESLEKEFGLENNEEDK